MNKTIITAHSGCDNTADNSLEFVKYAVKQKAQYVEVDIRYDLKGNVVLWHDEVLEGDTPILLKDAFLNLGEYSKVNCDLKLENIEQIVYNIAKECGVHNRIVYSGTMNVENFTKEMLENTRLIFNIELADKNFYENCYKGLSASELFKDALPFLKKNSLNVININYQCLTDEVIAFCNENDILISAWTVDDIDEAKRLIDKGIFNITTNRLKEYMEIVG